jgi:hypothetical protein
MRVHGDAARVVLIDPRGAHAPRRGASSKRGEAVTGRTPSGAKAGARLGLDGRGAAGPNLFLREGS